MSQTEPDDLEGHRFHFGAPELVEDATRLPLGTHCVSFHASRQEAVAHAVRFLSGTPKGQSASYWVADSALEISYNEALAAEGSSQVGCVHALDGPQVHDEDGKLRPVEKVREFIGAHPEGVTAAGETISLYWAPRNVGDHLEYEEWFESQPRADSRFLCPYDLRRIPAEMATDVMRGLGAHHSHVILSDSTDPAVRLLQLFVFPTVGDIPPQMAAALTWAVDAGYIEPGRPDRALVLTPAGDQVVEYWGRIAMIDWGSPRP